MHKTYVNKLLDNSRRARGAGRFGLVGGFACLAALLVMAPTPLLIAQNAAPPAPTAAPTAPPAAPPSAPPETGTFRRVEIYGTIFSSIKTGPWKARKTSKATILSLVVTSSDPLPIGKKGILLRKIEKPGDLAATKWVKVAEMTLRKIDASNKMLFDVDSEDQDVLINGKKEDHFKKGTKIKVQIDVEVKQEP